MPTILVALTLLLLGGSAANAACTCQCVEGRMQPLCDNDVNRPSVNRPIVCKPTVCPVLKPAVTPPIIVPEGCRQARVCDGDGGRECRWELVCQ